MPDVADIKSTLLYEYHATLVGGHADSLRTYARLELQFIWQGIRQDVVKFVKNCLIC